MDIFSHGLWGSVIWGRRNRRDFWYAFLFGISPDFFSFGIFMIARLFGFEDGGFGRPELQSIPEYVHTMYDITHSFVTFAVIFAIVWYVRKKPWWIMMAWPFHIFLDMFTHSNEFFPTPYLWPFAHSTIDGIPWSTPIIFFTNVFFLALIYAVYWYRKVRYNRTD
jgi:hypothetical protein